MKEFDCQDVTAVLSGLLDGELDREMAHFAEVHLSQCAVCRSMLERAERQDADMRAVMHDVYEEWPDHVEQAIWSAVNGPQLAFATERRLRLAAWSGWVTAAAACVLVGVTLYGPGLRSTENASPGNGDFSASNNDVARSGNADDRTASPDESNRSAANGSSAAVDTYDDGPGSNSYYASSGNGWPDPVTLLDLNESLARSASQAYIGQRRRPIATVVYQNGEGGEPQTVTRPLNMMAANKLRYDTFTDSEQGRLPEGYVIDERIFEIFEQMFAARPHTPAIRIARGTMAGDQGPKSDITFEEPSVTIASRAEPAVFSGLTLGDDLYHASVLLDVLASTDTNSFRDVQLIREAIESDRLLDRLAQAGSRLSADEETVVLQAWTALEFVNGPVDQASLQRLQSIIRESGVADRMEELSGHVTY